MKLKILQIFDRGVPNKERLAISVLVTSNLSFYAVFDAERLGPTTIVLPPKRAYWFKSQIVNPGDLVILYTGLGPDTIEKQQPGGHLNYFFHWGLPQTIWRDEPSCAVLLELNGWETSAP